MGQPASNYPRQALRNAVGWTCWCTRSSGWTLSMWDYPQITYTWISLQCCGPHTQIRDDFCPKGYTRRPIPQPDPHGNMTLWRRRMCGKYVNWKMATFLFHDHDIVSDKNNWIRALVDHIQHFKDPCATFWDCSRESHQGVVMTEGLSWWSYNPAVKK